MKIHSKYIIGSLLIIAALVVVAFFTKYEAPVKRIERIKHEKMLNAYRNVNLSAKGAVVYAPNTNEILYTKNATTSRPLASIAKLATTYVALDTLDPESYIKIEKGDLEPEGDAGLRPGDHFKVKDLIDIMLVASSNDAAEAVGRAINSKLKHTSATSTVFSKLNQMTREEGIDNIKLESYSGLDINNSIPTAFGSPLGIAKLLSSLMRNHLENLEASREPSINRKSLSGISINLKNTNVSVNDIPSLIASKTGYTDTAGGNLAIGFNIDLTTPIVIVVLGSENQETRFEDIKKLIQATQGYYLGPQEAALYLSL